MIYMESKELLEFIFNAHKHTYAAPKEIKQKFKVDPILPNHKDYDFVQGDWRYHDSYSGWWSAPGKEIVFYRDVPVWCMSYQGQADKSRSEDFVDEVFAFLKKALMSVDSSIPFRGPRLFVDGDFKYVFEFEGDYSYLVGKESIFYAGERVFFQDIMCSLIE